MHVFLAAPPPRPLGARRYLATEADGHAQRDRASRYFGPASLRAERSARLKRWRRSLPQPAAQQAGTEGEPTPAALLGWRGPPPASGPEAQQPQRRRMDLPSLNFLPLRVEDAEQQRQQPPPGQGPAFQQQQQRVAPSAAEELAAEKEQRRRREGETNEELLLRRTREFNEATRQRSHDVQLWLEFAHFQVGHAWLGWAGVGWAGGKAKPTAVLLGHAAREALPGRPAGPSHGACCPVLLPCCVFASPPSRSIMPDSHRPRHVPAG